MKNELIFLFFVLIQGTMFVNAEASEYFVLASPQQQSVVYVSEKEPECVRIAVQDLIGDVTKITGIELKTTNSVPKEGSVLIIGTAGISESNTVLKNLEFELPENFSSKWEYFCIEEIAVKAKTILPTLTDKEQKFFKTNLIAQNEIMLSLSNWYENLILARIILAYGHKDVAVEYLQRAVQSLERIDTARQFLTEGEKWQFWYRGDKKMNLNDIVIKTTETLNKIKSE
jgi:hypothetical protein